MSVLVVLVLLAVEVVSQSDFEDKQLLNLNIVFPGTKWCGSANIAENYDDLGIAVDTDKCCRQHDHCTDIIFRSKTKYNLTNLSLYPSFNCLCDEEFRDCLRKNDADFSNIIGRLYFTSPGRQCFREDYPKIGCIKRIIIPIPKCLEYEYDTSKPKQYQWFDVPEY